MRISKTGTRRLMAAFGVAGSILASASAAGQAKPDDAGADLYNDLQVFQWIMKFVRDEAVQPADQAALMQAAIKGMLSSLDAHSDYLPPEPPETAGAGAAGLGIEFLPDKGRFIVNDVFDDTPASQAGIKRGDVITHIGGMPLQDKTPRDITLMLRGGPDTTVQLTVTRAGENAPLEFELVRQILKYSPVKGSVIGDDIGYLRLSTFMSNAASADLKGAIEKIQSQQGDKIKGYILDLRGNGGGLVTQAREVADLFLDHYGDVVIQMGRKGTIPKRLNATEGDVLDGGKLTILIDGASASASEIVTGALADYGRATIYGTGPSFGKGTVQAVVPLSSIFPERTDGIKVTVAEYLTPKKTSIQGMGIKPDVLVSDPNAPVMDVREADLKGALIAQRNAADRETAKDCSAASPLPQISASDMLLKTAEGKLDAVLACAVDNLRGQSAYTVTVARAPTAKMSGP